MTIWQTENIAEENDPERYDSGKTIASRYPAASALLQEFQTLTPATIAAAEKALDRFSSHEATEPVP
jgi:hypothetical protein